MMAVKVGKGKQGSSIHVDGERGTWAGKRRRKRPDWTAGVGSGCGGELLVRHAPEDESEGERR